MNQHRFSILEWVFNEDTCSFSINFSVSSQDTEDCRFYTMSIPYALEEPLVFRQKIHSSMVLYVNNLRYLEEAKEMLSDFSFLEVTRPSLKHNNKQENTHES